MIPYIFLPWVTQPWQDHLGEVTHINNLQHCPCSICTIASAYCGQTGNKFGSSNNGLFPLGRPFLQGPKIFVTSKPIKVCEQCRQIIGKGISHPQPCTNRRQVLQSSLSEDPRGAELIASSLIREMVASDPKASLVIQLITRGMPLIVSKSYPQNLVKL